MSRPEEKATHPLPQLSPAQLKALLASGEELALIDVSEEGEFGLGHLLHAVNIPYSQLELLVGPLVPRLSCPIVLVDHGNGITTLAARRLRAMGYSSLSVLAGSTVAWADAGYQLFNGVYVPSKAFGEWVEHACDTPSIDAPALSALIASGADIAVLDPRTVAEHAVRHVPGATACPGAELLYRFWDLVPSPDTLVVVACGGRTRGIMGAQSLITAGVPNRVVALADGNHGWRLAGLPLEEGLQRRYGPASPAGAQRAREHAAALREREAIPAIDHATLRQWLSPEEAQQRSTFVLDVRSAEEHQAGHVAGARSAPGGQLIQATDQWIGTRGARIVLVDDDGVRAVQTAYWMRLMGWEVFVLGDGPRAALKPPATTGAPSNVSGHTQDADQAARVLRESRPALDRAEEIDPSQAASLLGLGALALSVDASASFLKRHPPGALWVNRARLDKVLDRLRQARELLLFSEDGESAHLVAADLRERLGRSGPAIAVVRGGLAAWVAVGGPVASTPEELLPQEERIDTLYWAHDRRRGNPEAMRAYLDWEKNLLSQLAADGFSFGPLRPTDAATHDIASTNTRT